ncbi:MAG: RNHCP domain-containing protein [Oscillospiraceae bacterium]|nr:RNHCP domain-containing protein [Oscillospiraceae bacterium]
MLRKFTVIDEGFTCTVCGAAVPPLGYTARNHCRKCLCSLHLDNNPGDRQSGCGGLLRPVGFWQARGTPQFKIVHKCDKCGEVKRNIAASDDDYNAIVELSARCVYENF